MKRHYFIGGALATVILAVQTWAQPLSGTAFSVVPSSVAQALHGDTGPYTVDLLRAAKEAIHAEPHPIVRVHLEGTLPTDPWFQQSWDSSRDWIKMMQLGMAYRITGDRVYLTAEERFLDAWLRVYKISFNPIDETPMDQMLIAYDLTRNDLPPNIQIGMEKFEREMATGYIQRIESEAKEDVYNWQSHRLKLALLCSYALGDQVLIAKSLGLLRHHLEGNLLEGNVVIDFLTRDALHYTVYDLEPLTMAALAVRMHGGNIFDTKNAAGASIKGAIDWLAPFALGSENHLEFAHTTAKFDITRGKAGVAGFTGYWNPSQSLLLYATAANLSSEYVSFYQSIQAKENCHTHDWLMVLRSAGL